MACRFCEIRSLSMIKAMLNLGWPCEVCGTMTDKDIPEVQAVFRANWPVNLKHSECEYIRGQLKRVIDYLLGLITDEPVFDPPVMGVFDFTTNRHFEKDETVLSSNLIMSVQIDLAGMMSAVELKPVVDWLRSIRERVEEIPNSCIIFHRK